MKYLILFDIDGTLINFKRYNSKEIFSGMINDIFGRDVPISDFPDFSGMTDLQILTDIAVKIGIPKDEIYNNLSAIWKNISQSFLQYCTPEYIDILPGVNSLLKQLASNPHVSLGLQTGNFEENAYAKLKSHNLDCFFAFGAFGSDHENRNLLPPLAIKRANEYHGFNIFNNKNTLVIGDSHRDIECAKSNKIPALAVATGGAGVKELSKYEPDAVFVDFSGYLEIYNEIFRILDSINCIE